MPNNSGALTNEQRAAIDRALERSVETVDPGYESAPAADVDALIAALNEESRHHCGRGSRSETWITVQLLLIAAASALSAQRERIAELEQANATTDRSMRESWQSEKRLAATNAQLRLQLEQKGHELNGMWRAAGKAQDEHKEQLAAQRALVEEAVFLVHDYESVGTYLAVHGFVIDWDRVAAWKAKARTAIAP